VEVKFRIGAMRYVPSGLVPSSKIPVDLLGPRYLGYRPANRFLPSRQKVSNREKKGCGWGERAYFECDMIVSDADLQLLFSDDIFLWPVRVVFPLDIKWGVRKKGVRWRE
jgi:hypothetical protein